MHFPNAKWIFRSNILISRLLIFKFRWHILDLKYWTFCRFFQMFPFPRFSYKRNLIFIKPMFSSKALWNWKILLKALSKRLWKLVLLLRLNKTTITIIFTIKISENNRDSTIIMKRLQRKAGPYFLHLQDNFVDHGLGLWTCKDFISGRGIVVGHEAPVDGLPYFWDARVKLTMVGSNPELHQKNR